MMERMMDCESMAMTPMMWFGMLLIMLLMALFCVALMKWLMGRGGHKGISGQERERVLPGRVPAKLADRDSGQAGKDYRGLTIVVVVSEYMQQSCSQSVGNAPKSLREPRLRWSWGGHPGKSSLTISGVFERASPSLFGSPAPADAK